MMIDEIKQALAHRNRLLDDCPFNASGGKIGGGTFFNRHCPECKSTRTGPCWVNVRADAALVDAVKKIVQRCPEGEG